MFHGTNSNYEFSKEDLEKEFHGEFLIGMTISGISLNDAKLRAKQNEM